MTIDSLPRLVMLGPAPEARGAVATVIEAYRAHGLFSRWGVEYLATHADAGVRGDAALLARALQRLVPLVAQERVVAHLHVTAERGLWRVAFLSTLAMAARVPFILHLHGGAGLGRLEAGGRAARAAVAFVLEHAACVLVPGEAMRSRVQSIARRARVECMPDPVALPQGEGEARRPNLILFIGRLEPASGVYDLLDALSELRPAVPDVRLLCAGEGDREALARHAERLGVLDAVKFTAWLGPSGKRALFESAAAFALPAYEETSAMTLLEAMAAGVPSVVTPVGGVPEAAVDGVSALFVAPGDVATLQRQLRKLLLDRKLGARIGAAARESVRLRCAPERALARLGALYAELGLHTSSEPQAPRPAH